MPRRAVILSLLLALGACDPANNNKLAGGAGESGVSGGYGNAGFGGRRQSGGVGGAGGLGGGGGECAREVRLTAVALGEPAPFDVIIVADHSQSLSWSRESLASGISTLLEDAREHTARIFVLTPTQYGESSAAAINRFNGEDMVRWRDPGSDVAYSHAMTEYAQTCTDADDMPIDCPAYDPAAMTELLIEGTWSFVMPEPIAAITPSMSDSEIEAQQAAVTDAILALGGTGSSNEQPLCTLNRYLLQNPTPLPAHAVFVVISDEDDATLPNECAIEYHYERATEVNDFAEECTSADCDAYHYLLFHDGLNQSLLYTCTPLDDLGNPLPDGSVDRNVWLGTTVSECNATSDAVPCDAAAIDWAENDCGGGHTVSRCTSSCTAGELSGCILQTTVDGLDFCTMAFEHLGMSYASIEAYCDATVGERDWLRCERRAYQSGEQTSLSQQTIPLVFGATTDALIQSFTREASARFVGGGYFAAVIGFHPGDAECTPQTGQSQATNLARIASSPQAVFSICGDYSGALASVAAFTDRLIDSTLELSLASDERISVVYAQDASGSRRMLEPALYSFDRGAGVLTLALGALLPTEVGVGVEVEKTCVEQPD